jgi:protein-disulfide isomerase
MMTRFWSLLEHAVTIAAIIVIALILWPRLFPKAPPDSVTPVQGQIAAAAVTHTLGTGPVVVVEFGDFQCPYCARFATEVFPQVQATLIATGRITFAAMDFPLPMHPFAKPAAAAVRCAGDQGAYWPASAFAFDAIKAGTFSPESLARALHLDGPALSTCAAQAPEPASLAIGKALGITGTPTFFIGRKTATGLDLVTKITGFVDLARFTLAVTEAQPHS